MLEINLSKNTNTASRTYGQYYGQVETKEVLDLDGLAQHMAEHNTPFSLGTITGILKDMVSCIRELTLKGTVIKIPNLALFKCHVESSGADSLLDYKLKVATKTKNPTTGAVTYTDGNIKNVKLVAQSTGDFTRAELNKDAQFRYTSKTQEAIDAAREEQEGGGETPEP